MSRQNKSSPAVSGGGDGRGVEDDEAAHREHLVRPTVEMAARIEPSFAWGMLHNRSLIISSVDVTYCRMKLRPARHAYMYVLAFGI